MAVSPGLLVDLWVDTMCARASPKAHALFSGPERLGGDSASSAALAVVPAPTRGETGEVLIRQAPHPVRRRTPSWRSDISRPCYGGTLHSVATSSRYIQMHSSAIVPSLHFATVTMRLPD